MRRLGDDLAMAFHNPLSLLPPGNQVSWPPVTVTTWQRGFIFPCVSYHRRPGFVFPCHCYHLATRLHGPLSLLPPGNLTGHVVSCFDLTNDPIFLGDGTPYFGPRVCIKYVAGGSTQGGGADNKETPLYGRPKRPHNSLGAPSKSADSPRPGFFWRAPTVPCVPGVGTHWDRFPPSR